MKSVIFTIFMLIGLIAHLKAQPYVDVIKLRYRYLPEVNYRNTPHLHLGTEQMTGKFLLPLEFENKDVLMIGGSFDRTNLRQHEDSFAGACLYSTAMQIGYIKHWNDKFKVMVLAIPRLNSDMEEITGRHFQLGGVGLVTYKRHDNLKYKFGMYYNREFFGNFIIPLVGIDWNVNDRLNIFGVLPGSMNVEYELNKRFYTGISYRSMTASFRLSDAPASYYVREGNTFWGHNQLWAFLDYYPLKNVVMSTGIGHTAWRQYDLYNKDKEAIDTNPVFQPFHDGFFAQVELAYRVRLDEK
ncbi:MAG: DUF6268 family outer membrane beta-barrel protein [Bacteroidia bacterium]